LTPKSGYKSITVKEEIYDYFYNQWLEVKDEYSITKGIRSFSAYVTYRLAQLMEEEKRQRRQI
jgi:hypothetical protein